jgi:thioesterase domain-containing protein/NAD(P)-dependent dehydrogenase (short-subunit alcohol dehydrogenase family)/acyl carrier protein
MSQTKHIGKVVLAMEPQPPHIVRVRPGDVFEQVNARRFTIRPDHPEDYASLLDATGVEPLRHVIHAWNVTPPEDARPETTFWREEKDRAFYSLFHLGKALAATDPDAPLPVSVLSTDMQRVTNEQALRPSKATLLGPCRVIPHEFPALRYRSIDVEGTFKDSSWRSEQLIDRLAHELLAPTQDTVVAYRGVDRWVQDLASASLGGADGAAYPVREGGVYLLTGGLGGLGLQVAEHLARSKPVNLVLTSRSGLPPRDTWATWLKERDESDPVRKKIEAVLGLEAYGAEVLVGAADVTDRDGMRTLVEAVRDQFGRVNGVIHAAGVVDDDLLPLKDTEAAARVLAPKVEGTLILDEVLNDESGQSLDFFVLFSSVSALVGLPGQVDYTAANAFLDAFAQRKQAVDGAPVVSINWSAWKEVGMAAEIAASNGLTAGDGTAFGDGTAAAGGEPVAHPLLDRRLPDADSTVFHSTLAPRNHWILDGHRNSRGAAILPGTGYLELARAAYAEITEQDSLTLSEVYFVSPLEIQGGTPRRLRIHLVPGGDGMTFTVESQSVAEGDMADWDEHASGTVRPLDETPAIQLDIAAVVDRCTRSVRTFGNGDRTRQEEHLRFGPRWRCLREVRYGNGEALARLELPEVFTGDLRHYKLHPALLDMATGFGLPLVDGYAEREDFYVPLSYEAVRLYRPLSQQIRSHVQCTNPSEQEMPAFDVTLTDAEGLVVAEITGFTMKRVSADALAAPEPRLRSVPEKKATDELAVDVTTGLRPAEGLEAFDRILASRSHPQIIVSTVDLPAWQAKIDAATAPVEEDRATDAAATDDALTGVGDGAASEKKDAAYNAPRDEVERTIADIWKGMLGLDRVGLNDNFFDMGGESLLAVRMFAKVRKEYGLDLPLAVLMEAPTLGGFADVVRGELGLAPPPEESPTERQVVEEDHRGGAPDEGFGSSESVPGSGVLEASSGDATPAAAGPTASFSPESHSDAVLSQETGQPVPGDAEPLAEQERDREWNPLVPIQPGGELAPFFCVHGAGGNVLNFRDLAEYLGDDQPFYGLQARGVRGERPPHERIGDMAAEYIEAIQTVQPGGPYRIGGYSGGGVVAFEMAHQLREEGETVVVLALLDSFCPTLTERPSQGLFDKFRRHIKGMWAHGWTYSVRYAQDRLNFEQNRLRRLLASMYEKIGKPIPIELRDIPMVAAYHDAVARYDMRFYPGPVTLFTARDKKPSHAHLPDHLGWNEWVSDLAIHKVPGSHDNIMQHPNIQSLTSALARTIEEVDQKRHVHIND